MTFGEEHKGPPTRKVKYRPEPHAALDRDPGRGRIILPAVWIIFLVDEPFGGPWEPFCVAENKEQGGTMPRTAIVLMAGMLVAALAAGTATARAADDASVAPKTTEFEVENLRSRDYGEPQRRKVIVAPSARALSEAIDRKVEPSGRGTYIAAFWGEKQTGGYSVRARTATKKADLVSVGLRLKRPGSGGVTAAFTYPYTVAVIKDLRPATKAFSFYDQNGRRLDWPVRRADR